jgi:hypothetical protein
VLNIADVVDLEVQLHRDAGAETAERDRAIGRRLGKLDDPRRVLKGWLQELRRSGGPWPGEGVRRGLRLLRWALAGLGLFLGAGAALAAFAADSPHPINVVRAWGLMVAPQVLLLLVTIVALLRRGGSPGFHLDLFQALSGRRRAQLHQLLERGGRHRVLLRWWIVEGFQIAAVAANVAMLLTMLVRLQFFRLAFGWETTFDWSPDVLHRLVGWIAAPWNGALPLELIARTQDAGAPVESRAWWPFLFMSVVVYGLLPRLILLVVARLRLRREESTAFERGGDYRLLLDRLRGAVIHTQEDPATAGPNDPRPGTATSDPEPPSTPPRAVVLWQLPSTALAGNPHRVPVHALYDPEEEPRAIEAIAAAPGESVLVLVPAWGNATSALKIFLRALRARLGRVPVRLAPVDEAGAVGSDAVRNVWRQDLADLRDSWIWVGAP